MLKRMYSKPVLDVIVFETTETLTTSEVVQRSLVGANVMGQSKSWKTDWFGS